MSTWSGHPDFFKHQQPVARKMVYVIYPRSFKGGKKIGKFHLGELLPFNSYVYIIVPGKRPLCSVGAKDGAIHQPVIYPKRVQNGVYLVGQVDELPHFFIRMATLYCGVFNVICVALSSDIHIGACKCSQCNSTHKAENTFPSSKQERCKHDTSVFSSTLDKCFQHFSTPKLLGSEGSFCRFFGQCEENKFKAWKNSFLR